MKTAGVRTEYDTTVALWTERDEPGFVDPPQPPEGEGWELKTTAPCDYGLCHTWQREVRDET
jgi:hypothetical protein